MVLRNVLRSRLRTAACIFAAAMGASVLVNGFMMQMALHYLIDFQFRRIMRSDIDLTFKDERGREGTRRGGKLPGVDRAEPMLEVACTFINGQYRKKGAITGLLPDATLTVPRDLDGRPLRIPAHGLAMSRTLADDVARRPRRPGGRPAGQGPAAAAVCAGGRNFRQLFGHGRLCRHPLPQPADRRGVCR